MEIIQTKILLTTWLQPLFAQNTVVTDDLFLSPKFFITIISGVILALAFQLILTALSVALGITAIGDLKEKFVKASNHTTKNDSDRSDTFDQDYGSDTNMGVKITAGFGIWSVITTCISLFGATALAMNLSIIDIDSTGITMGLVIWALFFIILFYLEVKIANTAIGGLIGTATAGLKASSQAVQEMFTSSKEKKVENLVTNTIDKIKSEFDASSNFDQISDTLNKFVNRVDDKLPNYDQLKKDITKIADKSGSTNNSGKWMAIQQALGKVTKDDGDDSDNSENSDKKEQLKNMMSELKENYDSEASKTENVKNMLAQFTDMDHQQIEERISKFKSSLQSAKPDSFSSDQLKKDMNQIFNDPKTIISIVSGKLKGVDRESIIDILDKNTNLDRAQIDKYAGQVEEQITNITSKFNSDQVSNLSKNLEDKVASFFNSTEREELNYDSLKNDIVKIIDNPSDSVSIIQNRLKMFDKNTMRALITNNKKVNDSDIDRIGETIEHAKSQVSDKLHTVETRARQQMEMLKRKAVIQAEHTRKTAASAAWWLVITAILSAGAAIAGGIVL